MRGRIELAEGGHVDAWRCVCGNRPSSDGFAPCDRDGYVTEPADGQWDGRRYVCQRCGRVIDGETGEVLAWPAE